MITINYLIIATGERRDQDVDERKIVVDAAARALVEVWSGHYAELELRNPERGWAVFPD